MTARTPGPWYAAGQTIVADDQTRIACTLTFYLSDTIQDDEYREMNEKAVHTYQEAQDNAAFIVLACNAHDTLTAENAALREALRPFAHAPCEYRGNIHCTMRPNDSTFKPCAPCQARASLAKGGAE